MASGEIDALLAEVGPRLRQLRTSRDVILTELPAAKGISKSTRSRLESGQRKPSLELLVPIAQAHRIPLDELVGAPEVGEPRIRLKAQERNGRVVVAPTGQPRATHAWTVVIPPERRAPELDVLSGQLRLILSGHEVILSPGEVAEFDTALPHWFGAGADQPVEVLSVLSRQGERIRVRAAPRRKSSTR